MSCDNTPYWDTTGTSFDKARSEFQDPSIVLGHVCRSSDVPFDHIDDTRDVTLSNTHGGIFIMIPVMILMIEPREARQAHVCFNSSPGGGWLANMF